MSKDRDHILAANGPSWIEGLGMLQSQRPAIRRDRRIGHTGVNLVAQRVPQHLQLDRAWRIAGLVDVVDRLANPVTEPRRHNGARDVLDNGVLNDAMDKAKPVDLSLIHI